MPKRFMPKWALVVATLAVCCLQGSALRAADRAQGALVPVADESSYWQTAPLAELKAGAARGNPVAQKVLGVAHLEGNGVPEDLKEAFKLLLAASEKGEAEAQYHLGLMYNEGQGAPLDPKEAARWFEAAAEAGLKEAQYNIGTLYALGQAVEKNDTKAAGWFQQAAIQGDQNAQYFLGLALLNGQGVPRNPTEAVRWLRPLAHKGIPRAAMALGMVYQRGDGMPQDDSVAFRWFERASGGGLPDGTYQLAKAYLTGKGAARDPVKAVELLTRNAETDHTDSQFQLGLCYLKGIGVEPNAAKAVELLRKAGAKANVEAMRLVAEVEKALAADGASGVNPSPSALAAALKTLADSPFATNYVVSDLPSHQPTATTPSPAAGGGLKLTDAEMAAAGSSARQGEPTSVSTLAEQAPSTLSSAGNGSPEGAKSIWTGYLLTLTFVTVLALACVGVWMISILKHRLAGLERELKETKTQIMIANKNLADLVTHIESRLANARAEPQPAIEPPPEPLKIPATSGLSSMKVQRGRPSTSK